ncbi:protein kinase domain-containing protein [Alicyclobacillus herbarius]|uniref:protein kinase domain-containing protein n=1 Tax=Alicyclobacillus herbarius TaxID=122960 RepID=UPI00040B42B6|nr:phosphotransferase [Alicyclobacillus herbarius]
MKLHPGTAIRGKWTQERITIERPLGEGANGAVYLVRARGQQAAMKVCASSQDVALEWAILEPMHGGAFPRPYFVDDAVEVPACFFYVMEWVPGQPLSDWTGRLAQQDWDKILLQLLQGLATLHQRGQAFCDIKPQNILLHGAPTPAARFVDVGGVTPFGRSVRQFTPIYDRAFWGMGPRRADAAYDLCALALMLWFSWTSLPSEKIQTASAEERHRFLEKELTRMRRTPRGQVLAQAVCGGYQSARDMWSAWQGAQHATPHRQAAAATTLPSQVYKGGRVTRGRAGIRQARAGTRQLHAGSSARGQARARAVDWSERVMWGCIGLAIVVTAAAWVAYRPWA